MNISNENRLLLYCAQTKIPEVMLDQVKNLISLPLSWEEVLESAFWHGIAPLLYHNLKGFQESPFIPQEVMDRLKKAYYRNMARNMYLYAELSRILQEFRKEGVEVIVLKGAALAGTVYGDIALRPFADLDLLVRKEVLPYAEGIMSALNYCTSAYNKSQEWYKKNHYHLSPYLHSDKSTTVEIHWHITGQPFHINIDDWWRRAKVVKISSCEMLIPSPEDMLLHLCLHLFNHGYNKIVLRGICDISETLRYYRNELNWAQFQNETNKYGINKPIYSILYLVKKIQGNNDNSLNWLNPTNIPIDLKLIALLEKRVFTEDGILSAVPGPLVQWLAADKFWEKMRVLLTRVFPTREVMSSRYSVPLSSKKLYFYYLVRPYKLLLKYGKFILDILSMRKSYINKE